MKNSFCSILHGRNDFSDMILSMETFAESILGTDLKSDFKFFSEDMILV